MNNIINDSDNVIDLIICNLFYILHEYNQLYRFDYQLYLTIMINKS
jgi:hypothetical protein